MHALDILGDPVRRRIVELLADGELSAGEVGRVVQQEFGISQPAVSQHLRVLRESGFAVVRSEGTRRLYALEPAPIAQAAEWFTPFERFWRPRLDALGTELARGARARRLAAAAAHEQPPPSADATSADSHTTDPTATSTDPPTANTADPPTDPPTDKEH
jgi:DNA-binding transcriptional ArsR family regulator